MENYEEKYNEALKNAKQGKPIEEIFPELAESEDEKIRKGIFKALSKKDARDVLISQGVEVSDALAWLEKQGEQKIDDDDKAILENWENIVKDNKEKWQLSDWFIKATLLLVQKVKQIGLSKSIVDNNKTMLNACINTLRNVGHSHLADWLEKQGELKNIQTVNDAWKDMRLEAYAQATGNRHEPNYADDSTKLFSLNDIDEIIEKISEKQGKQKPTEEQTHKFKKGDYIASNSSQDCANSFMYINQVRPYDYLCIEPTGQKSYSAEFVDKYYHSLTVAEILSSFRKQKPVELESVKIEHGRYYYCIKDYYSGGNKRASKGDVVQALRGMSMMALNENANEYFLPVNHIEQNPVEWSEEDEENLNWFEKFFRAESVIAKGKDIPQDRYLWFKNLKDRVRPKQEWSEEDEKKRKGLIKGLEDRMGFGWASDPFSREEYIDWLKSFKPNHWKPSGEQVEYLRQGIELFIKYASYCPTCLLDLYDDLKKLM